MAFESALKLEDLWEGEMKSVEISKNEILLIHLNGEVHAFEDRCAHQKVPLHQGFLDREHGSLTCCAHHWQFDAQTGKGINPDNVQLKIYPVRISQGVIYVDTGGNS